MVDVCSASLQGSRERQEDYCISRQTPDRTIAIVCDGMGGMSAGDIASRVAAEMLLADLEKLVLPQDMSDFFRRELEKLDDAVYRLKSADGRRLKAGTTLVAVLLQGRGLYWFSVGDSKLFCVRKREIHCVTRAHNYAMLCEMQSGLTADRMERVGASKDDGCCGMQTGEMIVQRAGFCGDAERGERLVSYLGMGIAEIYDSNVRPFAMMPGDKLLLCTDGLYRTVEQEEMARILSFSGDVKVISAKLESALLRKKRANQDNATWAVIGIKGEDGL